MKKITKKQLIDRAKRIKLLIVDVDGVLTDGGIILDNKGNELKRFNVRDGHGLKMVQRVGIKVAIITGRRSKVVERRAMELGIEEVYQGCKKKLQCYGRLMKKLGISDEAVAYVGDDIVDIPLFVRVGLPIAVSDAHGDAKKFALITTENPGGGGAVREITDFLIKAGGFWDDIIEKYSEA
jgi:3-deoxy-D-manno-octulosonate 8-phosphate phosphatase (KDO 8-P phosphatase)